MTRGSDERAGASGEKLVNTALLGRRGVVELALLGAAWSVLRPEATDAGTPASDHEPTIDVPNLAEDPTAVPVRVSVDHPMERDHFIESVELILDADPVPHEGTGQGERRVDASSRRRQQRGSAVGSHRADPPRWLGDRSMRERPRGRQRRTPWNI